MSGCPWRPQNSSTPREGRTTLDRPGRSLAQPTVQSDNIKMRNTKLLVRLESELPSITTDTEGSRRREHTVMSTIDTTSKLEAKTLDADIRSHHVETSLPRGSLGGNDDSPSRLEMAESEGRDGNSEDRMTAKTWGVITVPTQQPVRDTCAISNTDRF